MAASGPSQWKEDLDYARGRCPVVAINMTWKLAPWADMLYACDRHWWGKHNPKPDQFAGVRVVGKGQWPGCESAGLLQPGVMELYWDGKRIGGGWNSGFQVLNILALWKVARIIYTGLDCKAGEGGKPHWHGHYRDGACPNPDQRHFDRWKQGFDMAAAQVAERGIEVLNASRDTALTCFPRVELRDFI